MLGGWHYSLELWNLKSEKTGLAQILENRGFSINRTGNPFSRVAIDMALEQTKNAEVKSRLKRIIQFADISTAVNRWIVTGSMRSQITNRRLEMADLKSFNSDSKELNQSRIARDKKDVEKLKENICATTNPFSENDCKVALFNLRSGRQASITTENFLQNVLDDGVNRRDLFIKQCQEDESRFEKANYRKLSQKEQIGCSWRSLLKQKEQSAWYKISVWVSITYRTCLLCTSWWLDPGQSKIKGVSFF